MLMACAKRYRIRHEGIQLDAYIAQGYNVIIDEVYASVPILEL